MDQIKAVLNERGNRYGDFTDHARICQAIKDAMAKTAGSKWEHLPPVQKQALDVIADKIARILSGDPLYDDNWIDIQGYARLVQERLPYLSALQAAAPVGGHTPSSFLAAIQSQIHAETGIKAENQSASSPKE